MSCKRICGSEYTHCITDLDLKRNTDQNLVLIIFDQEENNYGAVRNEMIISVPRFKAYGHGQFLGISKSIRCIEGSLPSNSGVALVSFDSGQAAHNCLNSMNDIRESTWLGSPEIYIIPQCNPVRNMHDWNILQIDFFEVQDRQMFRNYINEIKNTIEAEGGQIITATPDVRKFKGSCRPSYVLIHQWPSMEKAMLYNKKVDETSKCFGGTYTSRAIVEMEGYDGGC